MKILFVADVHLEFGSPISLEPYWDKETLLILGGDIGVYTKYAEMRDWIVASKGKFLDTIYYPGNHEYYFSTVNDIPKEQGRFYRYGDIEVVAGTAWSSPSNVRGLNDFHAIKGMTPSIMWRLNKEWEKFLCTRLAETDAKQVVVATHFAPDVCLVDERYKGSSSNSYFFSDNLSRMFNNNVPGLEKVSHWFYGHTHGTYKEQDVGHIKTIRQSIGYPKERPSNIKLNIVEV